MHPSQRKAPTSSPFPSSMSSSSLSSSSFSSSAASSMLLHAAPPSDSSQSDILPSDNTSFSSSPPPSSRKRFFTAPSVSPQPRSSSLATSMGQSFSKAQPPTPAASRSTSPGPGVSTGQKLKRAFAGRRKKSEDSASVFTGVEKLSGKGKGRETPDVALRSPPILASSSNDSRLSRIEHTQPLRIPHSAKQLSLQLASSTLHVFSGRKAFSSSKSSNKPPPTPPKPAGMYIPKSPPAAPAPSREEQSASVMMSSPSMTPALEFLRASDDEMAREGKPLPRERRDPEKESQKEDWRKSDSTMTSHVTIRPGANVGSRSPRPLSIAESLQSTNTIVPVNKRLSALVTEADFATPEEDVADSENQEFSMSPTTQRSSPPSTMKSKNRRSMSFNLGPAFQLKSEPSPPILSASPGAEHDSDAHPQARTFPEVRPLSPRVSSRDSPALTRAAATGIISGNGDAPSPSTGNFRDRLAAWTAASASSSPARRENPLPEPPAQYIHSPGRSPKTSDAQVPHPSMRQTTVSMTGGFAPAAVGFGKRAVERMGRALGGFSSSSSSSGYSSSSSSIAPSSFSSGKNGDHHNPLTRIHSNQSVSGQSSSAHGKGKPRRTPNAPSATWSITSSGTSSSLAESDAFSAAPSGPSLGKRVRGPLRLAGGHAATGLVFGRELQACVRETAVNPARCVANADGWNQHRAQRSYGLDMEVVGAKALEDRMIPALVVRCAQHLLRWGVQEEGLFRITGRSSHVSKLRVEFDTGADYDMSECSPGELDPHAVASIFKAYLRELPEPILTYALIPYFEAALIAETNARNAQETGPPVVRAGMKGPSLPSGPRSGHPNLRKPPSLSTLAMPNFSGMRPPSQPLLNALASLISRLPAENRDLLRTATDLIKETAKNHKETKMPLSNLLLVFCPSLSMNPPLLRVLCEGEGIWDGPPSRADEPIVLDIKPELSPVLDIRARDEDMSSEHQDDDDAEDDIESPVSEKRSLGWASKGEQQTAENDFEPDDVDEEVVSEEEGEVGAPNMMQRKFSSRPLPLLPTYARAESSSPHPSDTGSLKDDASYVSASDVPSSAASGHLYNPYSPPALTSSADSLATPSTASDDPSLPQPTAINHRLTQEKPSFSRPSSPKIADTSDLPLHPPRSRSPLAGPVPFPSEPQMASSTPDSYRRSLVLSFPDPRPQSTSSPKTPSSVTIPSARMPRLKRPSLHLLFTKRTSVSDPSPISSPSHRLAVPSVSPYIHSSSPSTASVSTPGSVVTAPQASSFSLPPQLDMPIESSRMSLDMAVDGRSSPAQNSGMEGLPSPDSSNSMATVTQAVFPLQSRSVSSSTYESSRSHETPIADLYSLSGSNSRASLASLRHGAPLPQTPSQASLTLSAYDGLDDDEGSSEDDWARSVLKAAESGR